MTAVAARLLTATEAQVRSGRSMTRFRQWVAAGRLSYVVDEHGRRAFDPDDVDQLIAEVDEREHERRALEIRRREQEQVRLSRAPSEPDEQHICCAIAGTSRYAAQCLAIPLLTWFRPCSLRSGRNCGTRRLRTRNYSKFATFRI